MIDEIKVGIIQILKISNFLDMFENKSPSCKRGKVLNTNCESLEWLEYAKMQIACSHIRNIRTIRYSY